MGWLKQFYSLPEFYGESGGGFPLGMIGSATRQDSDAQAPRRQITADSFRALSSRLSGLRKAAPVVEDVPPLDVLPPVEDIAASEVAQVEPVETLPPVIEVEAAPPASAQSEPAIVQQHEAEEPLTLEAIKAENTPYPEDQLQAEQAEAETEILHDLIEAAESQPPAEEPVEPVRAELAAQLPPSDESQALPPQEIASEPIIETAILNDLVEAAEPVTEEAPAEPPAAAEASPRQTRDLIDWHIAEAESDQPPAIAEQDAPVAEPVAAVPDEATAFAFAEADATVKRDEIAHEAVDIASDEDEPPKAEQPAPPDIAHIRNVIAEARHWPDEATIVAPGIFP